MKIERKYMAHYLNATFAADDGTASYVRLGKDLEEYSPELSANVEKKTNILGNETVSIDSYQKQGEVSPYYAEKGDPLFEKLQSIIDNDLVLDDLKTDIVEVKLWDAQSSGAFPAVREECYIEVSSYGGDTTGYQIPFNVHYTGVKTKGTFNPTTKALSMPDWKLPLRTSAVMIWPHSCSRRRHRQKPTPKLRKMRRRLPRVLVMLRAAAHRQLPAWQAPRPPAPLLPRALQKPLATLPPKL